MSNDSGITSISGEKLNRHHQKTTSSKNVDMESERESVFQFVIEVLVLIFLFHWHLLEGIVRLFFPAAPKSVRSEIVLVTGAGHGIGKELALLYASKGAIVVCWDINKKSNDETVSQIFKLGYPKAHGYICNVANRKEVLETAQKVQKEVGDITILINNAGIMPCHPLLEHTGEEIERIMNINVLAHFWTLQAFLPAMIKLNHGHIVALSSLAGQIGIRNLVPYCASKFAVRGLMEAAYEEVRAIPSSKIKFTSIYPFMVNTGLCQKPVVRFPSLFPLLEPKDVARFIMGMQRRDVLEATVPRYGFYVFSSLRMYPSKCMALISDFLRMYVDSDLNK